MSPFSQFKKPELVNLRICSSSEMRELDRLAEEEYGIEARILMENAGRAAAQILLEEYPGAGRDTEILVFAGKGNNAGDAFVVARRLICLERRVRIFHLESGARYGGATAANFEILKKVKAKMTQLDSAAELESFFASSPGPFTIIDGILGTGLKGPLDGVFYDVVETINRQDAEQVVALDIPTGVNGDTGDVAGTSIHSTLTISFGYPKLGHFLPPGAARRGALVNVDISLPPRFRCEGDKFLLMRGPIAALLKERDRYGHKNSFGHTLLIGGSPGRLGAIVLAARATHKMGTGLVTVASWDDSMASIYVKLPAETMAVPLRLEGPDYEKYRRNLPTYSSVVVGPGLGMRAEGKKLLEELLSTYEGSMVIDADALNLIADHKMHDLVMRRRGKGTVLTPHPGEMARLLNWSKEEIAADPIRAVREAVRLTHSVVLLKGAATVIGSTDDVLYLNHYPNDGMATAGSGDVLSGMIGGLLGQGVDPFQGALVGVYLHSLAGDFAAKRQGHRSMTSADIIENIANAFKDIKSEITPPLASRVHLL
jgi:NAD(P)H-hydrate epimerase